MQVMERVKQYEALIKVLGKDLKENELMARHTTFRIGGPADFFYEAKTERELIKAIKLARQLKIPYFILGGGSNILVGDRVRGLVIKLANCKLRILSGETKIYAEAGVPLAKVVQFAANRSLSGLEFAAGIPGTVGGAISGNAGVKDEWIGQKVLEVRVLDTKGRIKTLRGKDCRFGYRQSRFPKTGEIILGAAFQVEKGNKTAVQKKIKDYFQKRQNQPAEPSAGSIFQNPKGDFAGRLIEKAGLKGYQIGGAKISEKHANFIVNTGDASARDVLALMKLAKQKVWEKFKVGLKGEIVLVGEFSAMAVAKQNDRLSKV